MEIPTLLLVFGKSLLFAVATVLPIINPLATAPVFTTLTHGTDEATRAELARSMGLGRRVNRTPQTDAVEADAAPSAEAVTKRRGRPPKAA